MKMLLSILPPIATITSCAGLAMAVAIQFWIDALRPGYSG